MQVFSNHIYTAILKLSAPTPPSSGGIAKYTGKNNRERGKNIEGTDALAVKKIWFDIFSIKSWNNAEMLIISSLYYMDREAEIFGKGRTIWSKKQLKKNVSCNRIGN